MLGALRTAAAARKRKRDGSDDEDDSNTESETIESSRPKRTRRSVASHVDASDEEEKDTKPKHRSLAGQKDSKSGSKAVAANHGTRAPTRTSRLQRMARKIQNDNESDSDASSESDGSSDDDGSGSDGNAATGDEKGGRHGGDNVNANDSEGEEDQDEDEVASLGGAATDGTKMPSFQDYFDAHARTSDNRLSSLPLLDHKEYIRAVRGAPVKHETEIKQGFELHSRSFPEWDFQLSQGFNLCFYGFGSKRKLLSALAEKHLSHAPLIVVNGFFPGISVKLIVSNIITQVVHPIQGTKGAAPAQINDAIGMIGQFFKREDVASKGLTVFVIIHNIDGEQLRNVQSQNALCQLAAIPQVRLVCSVDHINAPLLWDSSRMDCLSFLWHDVTTFEPYDVETSMAEDSGLVSLVRGDGARTLHGMKHVMRSLPANARRVFRVLADHQLAASDDAGTEGTSKEGRHGSKRGSGPGPAAGLPLQIYRRKCEEQFIPGIGSDVTFRAQLREFTDHKLMEQVMTAENGEVVFIPMESRMIRDLLVVMNDL